MKLLVPILLLIAAAGCGKAPLVRPFAILSQGQHGYAPDLATPPDTTRIGVLVITDAHDYVRLWRLNHGDSVEIPPVDFAQKCVLVAQAGYRASGGYSVRIDRIEQQKVMLRVYVVETGPCGSGGASTMPFMMVTVDRPCQPIETRWTRTPSCPGA